ncbi:MAG TPA: hypothetical protein VIX73_02810 [Kofleriaceae bacterium]|jgi:hypothetical protein
MTVTSSITEISAADLELATGGINPFLKGAAKFVGKKVLGPVSAAWTAYDATTGYLNARDKGKSVGESLWEGAKAAVW